MSPANRRVQSDNRPSNNLLGVLNARDYSLISHHLRAETRSIGDFLYEPGDDVDTVYFPCSDTLISFSVTTDDGRDVETILVGREGAVGGIVSSGYLPAYCRITIKFGGDLVWLPVTRLEEIKKSSPTLQSIFARYADCVLAQVFQSTACNAVHTIEQRTAKWILATVERTGNDVVPLTHEELASILGVGRSYVSRVIKLFKQDGILETKRGALAIRNSSALRKRACNCNNGVKAHFETVLKGAYP